MFRKLIIALNTFVLGIVLGAVAGAKTKDFGEFGFGKKEAARGSQIKLVRTTAYCHLENEPGAVGDLNCLGTTLRYDASLRSAAADWSVYPVGTQFRIQSDPGNLYEIDDYGSGLVGTETIDLYKPTLELMAEWGVRFVEIQIVKWGSFERSLQVMEKRLDYPHVAEMYQKTLGLKPKVSSLKPTETVHKL